MSNSENKSSSLNKTSNPNTRYQYRRDSRLEYRLFTIALLLANKYLDDNSYSNKAWSDVTGLELRKINIMEQEFVKYLDYRIVVHEAEYILWVQWLEASIRIVMGNTTKERLETPPEESR